MLEKLGERWVAYPAVAVLLAIFFALAITSVLDKCATSDEVVHLLAGYSYWRLGDYRVNPEAGNLPQQWMALPLLARDVKLPPFSDLAHLDEWALAQIFFYEIGNDPRWMLLAARVMITVLAVGLGVLVYGWSSRLFGRVAGLVSTVLYCFSPTILANGRLATSDLTATLFFLASVGCLWRMLHRLTVWSVLGSAVVMGFLFVSKMSAVLVVPMGLVLILLRLLRGGPLAVGLVKAREVVGRWKQAVLFLGAIAVHAAVVVLTIWAFYDFRYSAIHPSLVGREQMDYNWVKVLEKPFPLRGALVFAREHRLLPEAYLYGQAYVLKNSQGRWAFLSGRYSFHGWWWFFPYCFLVKTPLTLFAILALAAVAAGVGWRKKATAAPGGSMRSAAWDAFYRTAPLWVLLVVYWSTAIASKINIGHRHVLPTYPVLFILAGGAAALFRRGWRGIGGWVVGLLLVAYAAEGVWTWPNYLAYFNQGVGGPRNGYRHLVDSSLDWGQDLPGLRRWLDRNGLNDPSSTTPVYLSYFGTGSPTWHGIKARRLKGFVDMDLWDNRPIFQQLRGGVYCISASMLPMVLIEPRGQWSTFSERQYQLAQARLQEIDAMPPEAQQQLLRTQGRELGDFVAWFDALRLGRLMATLRHREVDDQVGYSILIYRLSDAEVARAVHGEPAELVNQDAPLRQVLGVD